MKIIAAIIVLGSFVNLNVNADGYQHGWKVYQKPQPGATYGGIEANPYGPGGSKSYGPGGGKSYGPGGGNSYGPGGGKSVVNPWSVAGDEE